MWAYTSIPVLNGNFSEGGYHQTTFPSWDIHVSGAWHTADNEAVEAVNTAFDFSQTISGLENGLYRVTVKGFYRNGAAGTTASAQHAVLYANGGTEESKPIASVNQKRLTANPGVGSWTAVTLDATTYYVPSDVSAAQYALHSLSMYETSLYVNVTGNTLTLGARKTNVVANDWCYFDDFTLTRIDALSSWNGVKPFNSYRIRNREYATSYLRSLHTQLDDQWWATTTTLADATLFYFNQYPSPTELCFYENTKPKYLMHSVGNSGTQEDPFTWSVSGSDAEGYQFTNTTRTLGATAADGAVTLPVSGSGNAYCWYIEKVTQKTVRRYYLYHPGQGVFLTLNGGAPAVTTEPKEAHMIDLSSVDQMNVSLLFAGTSSYLTQSSSTPSVSASGLVWNFIPTASGFAISNSSKYLYPSSTTQLSMASGITETQQTWKLIPEEEYREMVACLMMESGECYNLMVQCETGHVTPSAVSNGAGSTPPSLETVNSGYWYTKAHGQYINFKSFASASDVCEVYYPVHLPAGTYTITLWMVNAANTWMNIYYVGGLGTPTVTYNGQVYNRLSNGHLDFRGSDTGGANAPFYTKSRTFTIERTGDFLIGLSGGEHAGFDQFVFEAKSPVFCDQCYQYLRYYDTDATTGETRAIYRTQFVSCESAAASPLVALDAPEAPIGYTFQGWNTRADLRGMVIPSGEVLTLPSIYTDSKNVMSLYAVWAPSIHTITLDKGTEGSADGQATIKHEATSSSTFTAVSASLPAGRYIKGYYTAPTGGSKVINANGTLVASAIGYTDRYGRWTRDADCTLYAQYGQRYTVTFSSATAGTIRVLDDMGNELTSGAQVLDGTLLTLQARTHDGEHRVYQWSITSGSAAPVITETASGLKRITITDNTIVSVTYTTRSSQICSDLLTIECEKEWMGLGDNYPENGSVSTYSNFINNIKKKMTTPAFADNAMKVLQSDEFCTGFSGTGYLDFNTQSGEVYFPLHIEKAGSYTFTVYSNNGGTKYFELYKLGSGSGNYWLVYQGDRYTRAENGTVGNDSGNDRKTKTFTYSLTATDYVIGLQGGTYTKWDRIDVQYNDGGNDAFCHDREPIEINELPWSAGNALDHGDVLFVTPQALTGCVTELQLNVLGIDGDLFRVKSNGVTIMDNVKPGLISVTLTSEYRAHGVTIEGVRSVSLGEDNVVLGDNKGHSGFFVEGKTLYDANGVPFVMRGTNVAHAWYPGRTMTDLEVIAGHGANTVRIVLSNGYRWTWTEQSVVAQIIAKCEQLGLVCVLEVHDATGDNDKAVLVTTTDYWIAIKEVLIGHENSVIINLANEWMQTNDNSNWEAAYKTEIARLRAAGINHCLMVDANEYGQGASSLASDNAVSILNADPNKNVIFSLHMYQVAGASESTVTKNINNVLGKNLCLVIGEYGWRHMSSSTILGSEVVTHDEIKYQKIISYTNEMGVGALSWSWYGNSGGVEYLDMVTADNEVIATQSTANSSKSPGSATAAWGPDVIASWASAKPASHYNTEFVLQAHTIDGVSDDQSYTIWASDGSLNMNATTQLALGPEHFASAKVGDYLNVYRRSVTPPATAQIVKSTDVTSPLSPDANAYDINSNLELTDLTASPKVTSARFNISDSYYHLFTEASLAEAQANGMVLRGTSHAIQSVTLEAAECHSMRVTPDTLRIDEPLKLWQAYEKQLDFGAWAHLEWFTGKAWTNVTSGDIIRVRVEPSAGYDRSEARVTFRCYADNLNLNGISTWGDMSFDPDAETAADELCVSALSGKAPDAAGFVDIRVINADIVQHLQEHGLVIFGKNAKLISVTLVRGKFVIPADSAALVPDCGVDTLIIFQGGQVRNMEYVRIYKRVEYVRLSNGDYQYSTYDDQTGANIPGTEALRYTAQMNKWYTFTVPFDVNQILIENQTNHKLYSIHSLYDTGDGTGLALHAGSFYLKYLSQEHPDYVGEPFRQRWLYIGNNGYPQKETPYIILFADDEAEDPEYRVGTNYYRDNPSITYAHNVDPSQAPLLISGRQQQFVVEEDGEKYYYYHNNSLYDMQIEGTAYTLNRECTEFVLTEHPVIHPFECYIQATQEFKDQPQNAQIRIGRYAPELNDPTVTTDLYDLIDLSIMLDNPSTRAYDIMGREYDPQNLPRGIGVVILTNPNHTVKIIR